MRDYIVDLLWHTGKHTIEECELLSDYILKKIEKNNKL